MEETLQEAEPVGQTVEEGPVGQTAEEGALEEEMAEEAYPVQIVAKDLEGEIVEEGDPA